MNATVIALFILLVFHCSVVKAASEVLYVTIKPSSDWVLKEAQGNKCKSPALMPFRIASLRGNASVCGPIDSKDLHELIQTINLVKSASEFKSKWSIAITGNHQAAFILMQPVDPCADESPEKWVLFRAGTYWTISEKPIRQYFPCIISY